jgi:mycofactocin glycosyltransferase
VRYEVDGSVRRVGTRVLLGGSPLRLYRLTGAGADLWDRAAAGSYLHPRPAEQLLLDRWVAAGVLHPRPDPGAWTPADVTVVVPVRDRPEELGRLLASLVASTAVPARVVVVDDGSVDAGSSAEVARRHGADVVRLDRSGGPAAARNRGAAEVRTPLVAFVDSDCEVTPGWLVPLLAHLSEPAVAAVAPRVQAVGVTVAEAPTRTAAWLSAYDRIRSPLDLGPLAGRVEAGTRVAYVPAAALVMRRAAWEQVGGFDPGLRMGEDVDLVWRLVEAGHSVRYEPSAVVRHGVRTTVRTWLAQRVGYGTSAADLDARHPGALAPVSCSAWSALAWALAGAGHPVAGAAVAVGSTAALPRRLPDVPTAEAVRVAALGHLGAGRLLARAVVRTWWPIALVAATRSRTARRLLVRAATAVVVEAAADPAVRRVRGDLSPPVFAALVLLDDAAYGAGVWAGCLRRGRWSPLLPRLVDWPGRDARGQSTGATEANARARSSMRVRSSGSAEPTST